MEQPAEVGRRSLLRYAGTAVGGLMLSPGLLKAAEQACGADLQVKARENLDLGVFTTLYAEMPVAEAARRIADDGFHYVVFDYTFKDVKFDPWKPDFDVLAKITREFDKNDIRIAGMYAYYNPICPDAKERSQGDQRVDLLIKEWRRFGCPVICTVTGTFGTGSPFVYDPKNDTEEGYTAARDAFARLARKAEKTGAIIGIEPYWKNCIGSVERTARLFKDVPSPSLKLLMDPANYLRNEELPRLNEMMDELFAKCGDQIVVAHAKDVKAGEKGQELPAAGLGVLDYPHYLRHLAKLDRKMPLIVEHLGRDDVPRACTFVREQMGKI